MSLDILLVLLILLGTVVVLAAGLLRMDLVALLVLVLVAVLDLVPAERAVAGFANPAVLAVGGMFVLSAGLARTGVAELVGRRILALSGGGEARLIVAITVISALISGFMNNVGVVAMLLPAVVAIARKTSVPPSKLLIPLALGAQLGGFLTLIGTAPNLLASDALREAGFAPFGLFSFTLPGFVLLGAGTVLLAVIGPRLLPDRKPDPVTATVDRSGIRKDVELGERLFYLTIPEHSLLDGKTLSDSLIGSALGLHVLAVERSGRVRRSPGPGTTLRSGDRLLVQGRPEYFLELRGGRHLAPRGEGVLPELLESGEVGLARGRVAVGSPFVGRSPSELDLRAKEGVLILALRREDFRRRTQLLDTPLRVGDELLLQGRRDRIETLSGTPDRRLTGVEFLAPGDAVRIFELAERLWTLRVTDQSLLAGRRLGDTRLGEAVGMVVLSVARKVEEEGRQVEALPSADLVLQPGDELVVKARPENMVVLRGLQRLEPDLDTPVDPGLLEGGDASFAEAVLAPRSSLVGKTLREVNFRGRFGMHVVAIVREGEVVRANLRDEELHFGDALLLYGPRRHRKALSREPDFILLHDPGEAEPLVQLAPLSLLIMGLALAPILAGWLPVAVGVLGGAALMVVTRCLSPEDAYRAVDWPVLVLMAGLLALGAALSETGAAALVGQGLLEVAGGMGPYAILAALVLATALGGQIIPGAAVVVLMAPIAITGAEQLGVSPQAMVMAVAFASNSLASPVSQPAHTLVMAPAGYRPADYLRLGLPMTLLVLTLAVIVTPLFFPF